MADLTLTAYVWLQTRLHSLRAAAENEDGLSSVEWVALIGIVVTLLAAIGRAFDANGEQIGEAAVQTLTRWVASLGG
ncbi:hypothetical protein [Roseiflexus sp.]|uniref:hypothetical protein n=1 Tax=Roseiflexus sp. TaxID=2562120 RepID=UPI0021DC99FB|nr:hypothetical protein [Roseiflexus sp.]GIW00692.1 MAG: hypothetical protein KatS3mg058_2095 [Roseiflexus sp.]